MRHIDTSRLISLRRRNLGKKPLDTSRLTSLRRRNTGRKPLDTSRLTSLRRRNLGRKPLDTSRLTSLRRRNMDTSRLMAFRRNLKPYSTSTTGYRNNPDAAWGPTLYNPLEDDNHAFKDDSHYERTIAKLRRNPYDRHLPGKWQLADPQEDQRQQSLRESLDEISGYELNPDEETCPDCGLRRNPEEGTGLFRSIYSRNPDYALRAVTGTNSATGSPGQALYRSLFARRNPPQSIETATNSPIGQGLFTSIFSRRHNPTNNWNRPRHLRRRWGV